MHIKIFVPDPQNYKKVYLIKTNFATRINFSSKKANKMYPFATCPRLLRCSTKQLISLIKTTQLFILQEIQGTSQPESADAMNARSK